MSEKLHIALVQPELYWHDPKKNFSQIEAMVSTIEDAELIVLPEMWSTGFTMKAEKYQHHSEEGVALMKKWSLAQKAAIIGSLIIHEDGHNYNRLFYVKEGKVDAIYDKRHLFAYAGEDRYYNPGSKRLTIELNSWKIFPNICYDLRFPVWCRNTDDYDILLFSANWPSQRIEAWDTLLKARAIENQCYVLGVNCIGKDVWKNDYVGHSSIISYDGGIIETLHNKSGILRQALEKKSMHDFRENLPFLKDRDSFKFNDLEI